MTEKNPEDLSDNKSGLVNLNELADFGFGVAWSPSDSKKTDDRRAQRKDDGERREFSRKDRRPRREDGPRRHEFSERNRRPRPEGAQQGDDTANKREGHFPREDRRERREYRPFKGHHGSQRRDYAPVFHPTVEVDFYPQEEPFKVLVQVIRQSCRTYQLFDIAKTILQKPERYTVLVKPLAKEDGSSQSLYCSGPDNIPFETEEAAIVYTTNKYLEHFFELKTVEVEAPKGNFIGVARCTANGDLIAPPNYHRYNAMLREYHESHFPKLPFAVFQEKIEIAKDQEVVSKWIESMKSQTHYTLRAAFLKPGEEPVVCENVEGARRYLLSHLREKVVIARDFVRIPGKEVENMPQGNIRRSIETKLSFQLRFPLETANNVRGRLRRESLHLYKRGSKSITYVCAVRRKQRDPETKFADSIQNLISFVEQNPNVLAKDLPVKFLGMPELAEGQTWSGEDEAKIVALRRDLRWLIVEGYVTEFESGELVAQPILVKEQKSSASVTSEGPEEIVDEALPDTCSLETAEGEIPTACEPPPKSPEELNETLTQEDKSE